MGKLKQLGKEDILFVAGESKKVYQHTAGLVVLDTSACPQFDYDYFRERTIERIGLIPHFRWKLHEVPLGLDLPYWVEDENFSWDHHFKRIAVPSPGDREALGTLVAHLYSKHLDRSRPLWEIWFIEGLEGGKFAILQKLHHCVMDGQGANKLGQILCDFSPDAGPPELESSITEARAGVTPDQRQLSSATVRHLLQAPFATSRQMYEMFRPRILGQLWGQREEKEPVPELPQACFNGDISSDRSFVFGSVALGDIKRVKDAFGVTVNDVVLALVGSSMRNYFIEQEELPELSLRTGIAVSLREEGDDEFSNRVTNVTVTLATDLDDPLERLRAISAEATEAKQGARGGGVGTMEVMQQLPPLAVGAMMNMLAPEQVARMMGLNLIVSNVRGSADPMYIAGARLETMYPMSIIIPGMGINFTCVSYADNVDFGVTVAPELCPGPWAIIDGLELALQEYLALIPRRKPKAKKKVPAPRKKKASTPRKRKAAAPKKKATGTRQKAGSNR